jgi:transposase
VIVVGIDPHKKTHTAVAVTPLGEVLGELTIPAQRRGFEKLLVWARAFEGRRIFAVEDGRHVTGSLERFLLPRGEEVVRVAPKLMAGARRSARTRGKSDPIDARSVALAALREPDLPRARLAGAERDLHLLLSHREDLVGERTRVQNRLRWHLHDLDPGVAVPPGALDRWVWLERVQTALRGMEQTSQVRIALGQVDRCEAITRDVRALEAELAVLVTGQAPELLALPGCGVLTAAKVLAETAGVSRFGSEAKFAFHAGVAPLVVSSGERHRHRLNRTGNRQLNVALHRMAVLQGRLHQPARAFLVRKEAEGKSRMEALRCLKRHLARTVFRTLQRIEVRRMTPTTEPAPVAVSA